MSALARITTRREAERHPAVLAWRRLRPTSGLPESVEMLERRRGAIGRDKSYVFRLNGLAAPCDSIVAKLGRNGTVALERRVYGELLPALGVTSLRLFGTVEDDRHGMTWLFMEDAGEERFSPDNEMHRRLAADWLGRVHAGAPALQAFGNLPSHDCNRYLGHLRSAQRLLVAAKQASGWTARELGLFDRVLDQLDGVLEYWPEIRHLAAALPPTLVHGDFVAKNVRVRRNGSAAALLVLDWETAGRGSPAPDLVQAHIDESPAGLAAYVGRMKDVWPSLDEASVARLAHLGYVLRLLAAVEWAVASFGPEFTYHEMPLWCLEQYAVRLKDALEAARWRP